MAAKIQEKFTNVLSKVLPDAQEPIPLYGPMPRPLAYCAPTRWSTERENILAQKLRKWKNDELLKSRGERPLDSNLVSQYVEPDLEAKGLEVSAASEAKVAAVPGAYVLKPDDYRKWLDMRVKKRRTKLEKDLKELGVEGTTPTGKKAKKLFKDIQSKLPGAKDALRAKAAETVSRIMAARKADTEAKIAAELKPVDNFMPFAYNGLPETTLATMSPTTLYYPRKYKVACMELLNVVETEALDVKLTEDTYEEKVNYHIQRGLPIEHLRPPPKKSRKERVLGDLLQIYLKLMTCIQLMSMSFSLRAPWNWPFYDPSLPNLGMDVDFPPAPDFDLQALSLDASIPGLRFPPVPGVPSIGLPALGANLTLSIPTFRPPLNVVLPYFRWANFNYGGIGGYQAFFWTSVAVPMLFLLFAQIYFARDRFSKTPFLKKLRWAVVLVVLPLFTPCLRFLISPYSCTTTAVNGVAGRFIQRSLELNDPVSCDTTVFPFMMLMGGLAASTFFYFGFMLNLFSGDMTRPDVRYDEENVEIFFKCRILNFPSALAFAQSAVYVVSDVLGSSTPANSQIVAFVQSVFAVLTTLAQIFYPAYLTLPANAYSAGLSGASTWTSLVALLHIGQYGSGTMSVKSPTEAIHFLAYGIGVAVLVCALMSASGFWAWGIKDYAGGKLSGKLMPIFPFGLGKNLKIGGNEELGPDPEVCQCGGSVGGETAKFPEPCGGINGECFKNMCCLPCFALLALIMLCIRPILNFINKYLRCIVVLFQRIVALIKKAVWFVIGLFMACFSKCGCNCGGLIAKVKTLCGNVPFICCFCWASTDPDDDSTFLDKCLAVCTKSNITECISWIVCCPLMVCQTLRRAAREKQQPPTPGQMIHTPRHKPHIIKEAVWWAVCCPLALAHRVYVNRRDDVWEKQSKEESSFICRWLIPCLWPCNFIQAYMTAKEEYTLGKTTEPAPFTPFVVEYLPKALLWCCCTPCMWVRGCYRRLLFVSAEEKDEENAIADIEAGNGGEVVDELNPKE